MPCTERFIRNLLSVGSGTHTQASSWIEWNGWDAVNQQTAILYYAIVLRIRMIYVDREYCAHYKHATATPPDNFTQ